MSISGLRALVCSLILIVTTGWAGTVKATLNPRFDYGGKHLALYSSAIKEVSFVKVNVCEIGLYLENANTPADSILTSNQTKTFVLRFLIDVKGPKLADAWMRDLRLYCESECDSLVARGQRIADKLPDVQVGEDVTYVVFPNRVDVLVRETVLGYLQGENASLTILSAFLGRKAPPVLRSGLLKQPSGAAK